MIDLEPPTRSTLAAVLNGAIPPAGLALGALGSSALLQYAPGPTVTTYLVLGALIAAAGILCGFLSDTRPRQRVALATLRPRISLPRPTRPVFVAVIGSMISSWALGGLYLALGPTILIRSQHIGNHLAAGGFVATVTGVGALTGLVTRKLSARKAIVIGTSALIIGPVLTCVAIFTGSTWGLFGSSVIAGIGFGAGFQAGLRMILTETPEMARAGVLSTTYLVSYTAFGLPAVVAGFLVPFAGLVPVVTGYAAFVALTAAAALVLQAAVPSSRVAEFAAQQSRAPTS